MFGGNRLAVEKSQVTYVDCRGGRHWGVRCLRRATAGETWRKTGWTAREAAIGVN